MAHCAKTQELLDELTTPKRGGPNRSDVSDAVAAMIPTLMAASQRAAEIKGLALMARMAEPDPELCGRFEHFKQRTGGIEKLCQEALQALERLVAGFEVLEREAADFQRLTTEKDNEGPALRKSHGG